jgi:hypothetical protein
MCDRQQTLVNSITHLLNDFSKQNYPNTMKQILLIVSCLVGCLVNSSQAQQIIPLYDGAIPNAKATSKKKLMKMECTGMCSPYPRIYQARKTKWYCGHRDCRRWLWCNCLQW